MKKSIFRSICIVSLCVFIASIVFIMGVLYSYFSKTQLAALKSQNEIAATAVEAEGEAFLEHFSNDSYRITLIDSDGTVLYDSESSADTMENHIDREEVIEALQSGYGESSRYSKTLFERLQYSAIKLSDGKVLRMSSAHYSLLSLLLMMLQPFIIVAVITIALALLLANRLSKRIVEPLNSLDLDKPESGIIYEELTPLLERMEYQKKQLRLKSAELIRKQQEFNAATYNMCEGLVLLNEEGVIISINKAATRILSVSPYCVGKDILMLNNSLSLQELLGKAKNSEHGETVLSLNGMEYQMNASPIISDGTVTGVVLLIFDVTEKEKSEQMRREFTANVSHELKTPLQSISGYAELLKNGMVKPDDKEMFFDRIYSEAQRMITLVDDIIGLSRLDEGDADMIREETDLYALSEENIRILQNAADNAKVTLTLSGTSAKLLGVVHLLSEIVYNLCDNAIKYNRENGSVSVEVNENEKEVILSVSDTGIGIPEEHIERVFERFYRVDKSHSKEVGGTGLGLSIVKHAAKLHDASVEINSVVDGGTTVTVRFPKREVIK